jgi:hypothetical protein
MPSRGTVRGFLHATNTPKDLNRAEVQEPRAGTASVHLKRTEQAGLEHAGVQFAEAQVRAQLLGGA